MKKIERETVVDEYSNGRPHLSLDERGDLHHYGPDGAELRPIARIEMSVERLGGRPSSGPAKVTSNAYRAGFDAIDWSKAN